MDKRRLEMENGYYWAKKVVIEEDWEIVEVEDGNVYRLGDDESWEEDEFEFGEEIECLEE